MEHVHTKKVRLSRGFALIFAILASSLLISIALSVWNIASREVAFSSFGRESQIALFAADTGAECALYWDLNRVDAFATSTDSASPNPSLTCVGITIAPTIQSRDARNAVNTFWLNGSGICVVVIVTKSDPDLDGFSATQIEARGRNSCNSSDPTVVERGLRVTY
jgi:hypothetical protein